MEVFFTKEKEWLDKWDVFVSSNKHGSHLLLSDWLKSYKSYGFDFEVAIFLHNHKIVGGFGAVIAKMFLFKFYIVPHGPIFLDSFTQESSSIIEHLFQRAKQNKCCYVQYSMPFSEHELIDSFAYNLNVKKSIKNPGNEGNLFKYIYSSYGINWLNFGNIQSAEELLKKYTRQVRRNINLAYRNEIKIGYAETEEECRLAYKLIEENARIGNYSVRSFDDFKETILSLISKERAYLISISWNDEIKGAAFIIKNDNYLTYISGGTKKEKPDLNIGYIIHWEIIKESFKLGYKGYNISMGGSKGVADFKAKFAAQSILYDKPHYHLILKPTFFKIYLFLNKFLKKNKERVISFLKKIK